MAEFLLTPETKNQPAGTRLMEELHRRGYPVEITLKGPDQAWQTVRFYEQGPPEVECLLDFDSPNGTYKISVSRDASHPSADLQLHLVGALLQELGGRVDNLSTQERFTPSQFAAKLRTQGNPRRGAGELLWIGFAWAVAAGSFLALVMGPGPSRPIIGLVLAFASLSAAGLTYFHFKPA